MPSRRSIARQAGSRLHDPNAINCSARQAGFSTRRMRKTGTLRASEESRVDGNGLIGPSAGATTAPTFAPRQTPFPVLPLPHFSPHLAVAERGAP